MEIALTEIVPSKTNTRTFDERDLDELVESIKKQGVLQPVLVRPKDGKFELIAGERRLRSAKLAGLKGIPANVREMTDVEAREAQIVENLQRKDIHPMDEGEAYRQLIESGKMEVKDVAARVGKDERYVRGRLVLTNLSDKLAKAFRDGKMKDGHAALIARLTAKDQEVAWKSAQRHYGIMSVKDLKDWIDEHLFEPLENQPWTKIGKDQGEIEKMVGACVECQPNVATLFGPAKVGACTSYACWKRKMDAWVALQAKERKAPKITLEYGEPPKGSLSRGQYTLVGKNDKVKCAHAQEAVVSESRDIGRVVLICKEPECKVHHAKKENGSYQATAAEKATRKRQLAEKKAKDEKMAKLIQDGMAKVKWPMTDKQLDALYELVFDHVGTSFQIPVLKRHGVKAETKTSNGYTSRDYEKPLRAIAEKGGKAGKIRMIFELLLPMFAPEEEIKKILKAL